MHSRRASVVDHLPHPPRAGRFPRAPLRRWPCFHLCRRGSRHAPVHETGDGQGATAMNPPPLTYVYLYAPNDMPDHEVERRTVEAENYATKHRYGVFKVFYEWDRQTRPALGELVAEIGRS